MSIFRSFFGGIDFQNNLNRSEQMNAIMSLVARRVANEFSCLAVYHDLRKPPRQRRFFGALPEGVPDGALPEARARRAIVHLFEHILGQSVEEDGPDVTLALGLFLDIQSLVRAQIEMAADDEEAGEDSDDGPEFMPVIAPSMVLSDGETSKTWIIQTRRVKSEGGWPWSPIYCFNPNSCSDKEA